MSPLNVGGDHRDSGALIRMNTGLATLDLGCYIETQKWPADYDV